MCERAMSRLTLNLILPRRTRQQRRICDLDRVALALGREMRRMANLKKKMYGLMMRLGVNMDIGKGDLFIYFQERQVIEMMVTG